MKKTLLLLSALLVLPISAQAHSVLEASTPAEGEVVTEPLEQIALDFSAGIEEGSTMTMTVDGEAVDFSEVAVVDDQLVGTPAQELQDGVYNVAYDVLSEDGHPIDGTLAFELDAAVAAEEETATEEESNTEEAAETEAAEPETAEEETTEQATASGPEASSEDAGSSLTFIIAGFAVLLLIGAVVLMRKKR